jgi:cystathionine gamma-lyase
MENPKYTEGHKKSEFSDLIASVKVAEASHTGFSTNCIHAGQPPETVHGSVNVPIHLSSTYAQKGPAQCYSKFDYTRCGNPTTDALCQCIAALEHAKFAQVFSSGCGATACINAILKTGEHIVCCDDVYGGTNRQLNKIMVPNFGIQVDFVDMTSLEAVEKAIKPNTRMIWIETPTNPTLKVADIQAICEIAKKHNVFTVVDNTFASPYFQSPLLLGADISYNSMTKYLGGHSDVVAGCIATNSQELYDKLYFNCRSIGTNQSPFDSYMLLRGIKTLKVRMEAIHRNAHIVAKYLETHPKIEKVIYPGLESHPQHAIAKKQMRGFSGMISFLIKGGRAEAEKVLKSTHIFTLAESLGGVESLIEYPYVMTHASVPEDHRNKLGINDKLIRISVGIEDPEDLLADLKHALE